MNVQIQRRAAGNLVLQYLKLSAHQIGKIDNERGIWVIHSFNFKMLRLGKIPTNCLATSLTTAIGGNIPKVFPKQTGMDPFDLYCFRDECTGLICDFNRTGKNDNTGIGGIGRNFLKIGFGGIKNQRLPVRGAKTSRRQIEGFGRAI